MKFRELPQAMFGRLGEICAAREFRRDGFGVIASFKYSGADDNEAPAIEVENRREIVPDLDICARGERFWVEVKTYKEAAWNRRYRCWTHGISVRHFDNYLAVEQRTGSAVFLAINELGSGSLLMSARPISEMQKYPCLCGCESAPARCRLRDRRGYPEWYFDRDTFRTRYTYSSKTIQELRAAHAELIAPPTTPPRKHQQAQMGLLFPTIDPARAANDRARGLHGDDE